MKKETKSLITSSHKDKFIYPKPNLDALREAVRQGDKVALLKLLRPELLEQPIDNQGNTLLLFAASCGRTDMVKWLIALGANRDAYNEKKFKLDDVVCFSTAQPSASDKSSRYPEIIKYWQNCKQLDALLLVQLKELSEKFNLGKSLGQKKEPLQTSFILKQKEKKSQDDQEDKEEDGLNALKDSICGVIQVYLQNEKELNKLMLLEKIEMHATLTELLGIVESSSSRELLIENMHLFFQKRATVLENTGLDYSFADNLTNRICSTIAGCKEFVGDESVHCYDVLLKYSKTARRPKYAPVWKDFILFSESLPENPGSFVRWNGEIHDWSIIVHRAISQLKDGKRSLESIWLKTDSKKTPEGISNGQPSGSPGEYGPLPKELLPLLRQKGPACQALVDYTVELSSRMDILRHFADLREGLSRGSRDIGSGTEMKAGPQAAIAISRFFEWWNQETPRMKTIKNTLEPLRCSDRSIKQLLTNMQKPQDGAVDTCTFGQQAELSQILRTHAHVLQRLEGMSTSKSDNELKQMQECVQKELGQNKRKIIVDNSLLAVELFFDFQPVDLSQLLIAKIISCFESNNYLEFKEIILTYPNLIVDLEQAGEKKNFLLKIGGILLFIGHYMLPLKTPYSLW